MGRRTTRVRTMFSAGNVALNAFWHRGNVEGAMSNF
jgi:hypothetical protein